MGEKSVAFAEQIARESAAELRGPPPRDPFAPSLSSLVGGGGGAAPSVASSKSQEVALKELKGLAAVDAVGKSGGGSQLSAGARASAISGRSGRSKRLVPAHGSPDEGLQQAAPSPLATTTWGA